MGIFLNWQTVSEHIKNYYTHYYDQLNQAVLDTFGANPDNYERGQDSLSTRFLEVNHTRFPTVLIQNQIGFNSIYNNGSGFACHAHPQSEFLTLSIDNHPIGESLKGSFDLTIFPRQIKLLERIGYGKGNNLFVNYALGEDQTLISTGVSIDMKPLTAEDAKKVLFFPRTIKVDEFLAHVIDPVAAKLHPTHAYSNFVYLERNEEPILLADYAGCAFRVAEAEASWLLAIVPDITQANSRARALKASIIREASRAIHEKAIPEISSVVFIDDVCCEIRAFAPDDYRLPGFSQCLEQDLKNGNFDEALLNSAYQIFKKSNPPRLSANRWQDNS